MPSATFLSSLQEVVERSPEFLRFAVRLLQLADILYKDKNDEGKPSLRILPDVAQLLLGPTRIATLRDLFELWLAQSSYGELFELQEDGLRLRCRATSLNLPILRSGELDAENSEARQTIIALLAQAPLNQWISFSACSLIADTTRGWEWPTARQTSPELKSMNSLPSTSLTMLPCPLSAANG